MANNKKGFIYYSVDTDRYQDKKIKKLKKDFGCNGIAVYDYILCEIYRIEGCFLVWDESTAFDVADYFGLKESSVEEIVTYCCVVGLFDKAVLTNERKLTSLSIQSRFIEWSKKAKRINFKVPEEIAILPELCLKSVEEFTQNSDSLPRSKVKESKVKESKWNTMPTSDIDLKLPEKKIQSSIERLFLTKQIKINKEQVFGMYEIFKSSYFTGKKYYGEANDVFNHFENWLKDQPFKNEPPLQSSQSAAATIQNHKTEFQRLIEKQKKLNEEE